MNRLNISNALNKFFMNTGKTLHDKIPPMTNTLNINPERIINNSMLLFDTNGRSLFKNHAIEKQQFFEGIYIVQHCQTTCT